MKSKTWILACICWTLTLSAAAALAEEAAAPEGAAVETATVGPDADVELGLGLDPGACLESLEAPIDGAVSLGTCFVQMECADETVISCSGNSSCSTGGTGGNCVICDGVQQACCQGSSCCQWCEELRDACFEDCGTPFNPPCSFCASRYVHCINNCTGGCS